MTNVTSMRRMEEAAHEPTADGGSSISRPALCFIAIAWLFAWGVVGWQTFDWISHQPYPWQQVAGGR